MISTYLTVVTGRSITTAKHMSDITVINDSEQSSLVTNGLAKNGELYLKAAGSTDAGAIVVYDSGVWRTFANEASSGAWNGNTYSVDFDGTNDYVEVADSDDFSFGDGSSNSAFSYSFWVRVERSSTNVFQHLISKGSSSNSEYLIQAMPPNSYGLNADSIYFALYPGTTSGAVVQSPASSISLNTWHHIVCTVDGTGNRSGMKIYIDGVSQTLTTSGLSSLTMINSTDPLRFGARSQSTAPNSFLQGKMDEIALFNSELSSSNVTSIYNSGAPDDLSSLSPVGWWRMGDNDGGTGTTITDQGSGGNDAALANGPTFSTDVPS